MDEYKQPKTRIKAVEDGNGARYYPQYLIVLIPFIWWGWETIYEEIGNPEYLPTLDEAKGRIDEFLIRQKRYWLSDIERRARIKVKKVSVIDYPRRLGGYQPCSNKQNKQNKQNKLIPGNE